MVGQGLRFALARVVSRPKPEQKQRSKTNVSFTCLQGYATISITFLETAQRVLSKSRHRGSRSSTSASNSNNYIPITYCPLLRADTLEELDWSMGIDVDTSSKTRPTIGHAAELFLDLWEYLLHTCEQMLQPSLEASTDFGDKMRWEKTELVIVKIMERREFNKVYEAFRTFIDDKENNSPITSSTLSTSQQGNKKNGGLLRKRTKSAGQSLEESIASEGSFDPPFSSDPLRLLSKYVELLHRTLSYASSTDIRSVMASTIYNSVFSIAFCRFPRAHSIILNTFDSKGFNGGRSPAAARKKKLSEATLAKRTFFEDDNPALFGWEIDDVDNKMLQPYLNAIYDCIQTNLALLTDEQSSNQCSTDQTNDDEISVALDDLIDANLRQPVSPPTPTPTHPPSSLCVSMFLALWIAMTHHILRTSRGHIPWREIPAYRHLHERGILLFEKAYAMQTLECDDDSNLVRYDMVMARREKLDIAFPVEILYPQVVFATSTKIIGLTRLPLDFISILFKYTLVPFVRAVPACMSHLEHWIGVLPMDVFADVEIHTLLVKHVRKILKSDRVDQLKSILIFLLHCTGLFSSALQNDLLSALLDSFNHLFRHWFRDVRFCYHLLLLYLFGDRRQLGSRSDVILLGLDTESIMSLQRHPAWLPFDEQLLEALEACRDFSQTTPYDRTSFNEYIGQLEHYHQNAEALPEGEAVPIPRIKLQQQGSRGVIALYRSVIPCPLPISRLKIFQYLVAAFCIIRSLSFVTGDLNARDVINRLALCIFFTVVLFQVFFWFDIVNPGVSVRSKRIWNTFIAVNLLFYLFVLVLQLMSPPPAPEMDDESRVRVNFWFDLLPILLVALGSLACSAGMFYLSCKMRLRVQRLVDEADTSLSQQVVSSMYRALAILNAVLLISSMLFAMRTVFYMQRPWSHKECGAIQDPNVCILVGYVLPEIVPCVLFLALMWEVDPRVWTTRLTTTETTPLLRKQHSTFETQNEMWQRPFKSPHISIKRPSTPSPRGANPWDLVVSTTPQSARWLSFQCFHLKCPSDVHSSFIVVTLENGHEIGRTDIAHTKDPIYHVMLKIPSRAIVNIQVFAIRNMNTMNDLSSQWLVGQAKWTPQQATVGRSHLFRLDENDPDMSGLLVVRCEATVSVDTSHHLTRAFFVQELPKVLLEEELVESPFTWEIPFQMLQLIVADLTLKLDHLKLALEQKTALSPLDASPATSLLSDMIYHLQGNKRKRTNQKWRIEMIQLMETYLAQTQEALRLYKLEEPHRPTFKPSTKKADPELRFLALNLHAQIMTIGSAVPNDDIAKEAGWADDAIQKISHHDVPSFKNHRLFGTVTVGAFAAHVYGFNNGGIRQLRDYWDKLRDQSINSIGTDLTVLQRDMHAIEWQIDQRLDVAFAQAVSALVTSFQQTLYVHFHTTQKKPPNFSPELYMAQLQQHGFLFSVESLLSTVGNEAGMLGDMDAAVKALAHVTLQLHVVPTATFSVTITSRGPDGLIIELPLLADDANSVSTPMMHRIPGQDKASGAVYLPQSVVMQLGTRIDVRVIPVLFNQGMNEIQTVANTVGRSQLQEDINQESADVLEAYLLAVPTPPGVMEIWSQAKSKIEEAKAEKVMDIVAMTSWIARQVGGGRVTCCKSAKDRTAMSVTLEEAQWMDESRETQSMWTQLLRTYGVRRENARKNIGTAQYAFNVWQNYLLPSDYKCPPGTGGGGKS